MKKLLFTVLIACIGINANAYNKQSMDIDVNGTQRNMVVFTPDNMEKNMPLMIITHGMNQNPEYQMENDHIYEMVDTAKFVVAYLRSSSNVWDIRESNDQNFVENSIVELYKKFSIDRHRVYWSGFSMGSMLMYHCMHNMQGKIAAFAPTSGIMFMEQPWEKCQKPVNLIECTAYGDDVFKYEQFKMHEYVENMAKMNKFTKYADENFRPAEDYDGRMETWTNDNGNIVKLFSFNNGGHCPKPGNGPVIWNFCKQFSLTDAELDPLP